MIEAAADTGWKGYSIEERDRRWNAVRQNAARERLDCILVPKGNRLDARYLTQMPNVGIILPTDGRPPIVLADQGRGNEWVDIRPLRDRDRPRWGEPTAEALLELGMERGRIGVAGLGVGRVTHARAPDGVVNHVAYAEVLKRLPNATFVDATDVVGFARYVKSEAEIACLRRATAIAEAGIEEMIEIARPGVDEAVLYGRVTGRLMELGSEHYNQARSDWTAHGWALKTGPLEGEQPRFTSPPIGRRLQHGTFITNEVSAIWGDMVAQEVQPILLAPIPDRWKTLVEVQRAVWQAGLVRLKAGTAFMDLIDFVKGFSKVPGVRTTVTLHGRGVGDDGPLITSRSTNAKIGDLRLEAGTCWVWKPAAVTEDGKAEFQWGGDVVVRADGGEKLFTRPHAFVSIV